MKKIFSNRQHYLDIVSKQQTNPLITKKKLVTYLKKYPQDYLAHLAYAAILITFGDFASAEKIINFIEKELETIRFKQSPTKIKKLTDRILIEKLRVLSYRGKYQELYQLCTKNRDDIKRLKLTHIDYYCRVKLNKSYNKDTNSYKQRQMVEYQESEFRQHIEKHLANNIPTSESIHGIFVSDFPIDKILEEIKKYIPSDYQLYPEFYIDSYYFKFDECGISDFKPVDFIKVICFHDTADIITMHPTENSDELPYVDLNYLTADRGVSRTRRMQQTEALIQKYKP